MKGNIGIRMGLRSVAPPNLRRVKQTVTLSKPAKLRLAWFDYYQAHGRNAALVCRHFGIAKSCFFKWKARYDKQGLVGLEAQSQRPVNIRKPTTPTNVVAAIRTLRKATPEYSKYKLAVILKRDHGYSVSASTVGRVISRYQLFFTPPIRRKGHPGRQQSITRLRKPKDITVDRPGRLVEFDVKHIPCLGAKRYGFVTIDVFTKQASVYVGSTISSTQGALAWKRARYELGLPDSVQVLNDNGSENFGAFAELLKEQHITQYFARPRTPKDKPHVERFIGSLERECLQWGGVATDLKDQQVIINQWLSKYHGYRPHQSLGYLTPNEYKTRMSS
jgi:transposase InsO family protein